MKRLFSVAFLLVLAAVSVAYAEPMIQLGDVRLHPNTPDQTWRVMVSSSPAAQVDAMDFYVRIGNGQTPSTLPAPRISALDILGTAEDPAIFYGHESDIFWAETHDYWAGKSISLSSGNDDANGLLAAVTFDTTGVSSGVWDLALKDPGGVEMGFGMTSANIAGVGRLIVETPEPATAVMLLPVLFGLGSLARRRR